MAAQAQVSLHIDIGLPVAPPLVEVAPRVQVVEGFGEEVFFFGGWYWCRRPDGWYRARSPRARFDWIEGRRVPRDLVVIPAGHYRNWRREEHRDYREEHRAFREDRREREKDRDHDRGHGREHDHGRGHDRD
jgi:hypothetical protein